MRFYLFSTKRSYKKTSEKVVVRIVPIFVFLLVKQADVYFKNYKEAFMIKQK